MKFHTAQVVIAHNLKIALNSGCNLLFNIFKINLYI